MIRRVNHIGIAVKSLDEAIPFYRDQLALPFEGVEEVPSQKVKVAFFACGETRIELLEPTAPDSPVALFIEKKGPGIHHVAYEAEGIAGTLAALAAGGVQLIDKAPRPGAHGMAIAFLHPKSTGGVLTELCERGNH